MALSFRPYFEGGIESLVENEILPPLEFSNFEQYVDCVKGKYVKKVIFNQSEARELQR
jgi:hypothetical protein